MFRSIPTVTKNLLIVNFLAFLATQVLETRGIHLTQSYGLHFFMASDFNLLQFITYMFLHANMTHVFFNMFALWMFGVMVENAWGPKKFLFYYISCGIGAGLTQEIVQFFSFYFSLTAQDPNLSFSEVFALGQQLSHQLNGWTTIGASGAVYAVLLAFGMVFPRMVIGVPLAIISLILLDLVNTNVMVENVLSIMNHLFFIAIFIAIINPMNPLSQKIWKLLYTKPVEARWCVIGYIALEILYTWKNIQGDNVAHMAHLGGMLFGFLMIRYWNHHPDSQFNHSGSQDIFGNLKRNFEKRKKENLNMHAEQGGAKEDDWEYNSRKKQNQEEIDAILDKIRKSGYDSLTKEEKQRLFEASRNL